MEDGQAASRRQRLELGDQTRLADPGVAAEDDEVALARQHAVEPLLQVGQLVLATDQGRRLGPAHGPDDQAVLRRARVEQAGPHLPQAAGERRHRGRPIDRRLGQAAHHDGGQLGVDGDAAVVQRLGVLVGDPVEDRLRLADEGRLAGDALVEHVAEGVDVRGRVGHLAGDVLRAEVGDGADQHARAGQGVVVDAARQAEVHHGDAGHPLLTARHEDVGGLDVAVDDPARVGVREGLGDRDPDVDDARQVDRRPDHLLQAQALDHGHDIEQHARVATEVVDRDDRRVTELGDRLRLAAEAPLRIVGDPARRGDDLDRYLAAEHLVAGPIDHSHATLPELREHFIATRKRSRSSRWIAIPRNLAPTRGGPVVPPHSLVTS